MYVSVYSIRSELGTMDSLSLNSYSEGIFELVILAESFRCSLRWNRKRHLIVTMSTKVQRSV